METSISLKYQITLFWLKISVEKDSNYYKKRAKILQNLEQWVIFLNKEIKFKKVNRLQTQW